MPNLRPQSVVLLAFLAIPGSLAVAQDLPEEDDVTLAPEAESAADEELGNLVFDEATGSYRLIDEDADDLLEEPSEREQTAEELQRLFDLYREALANKDYLEADTLAKRVVELSIRLNGLDSHDSAKAITNLGIAQHNNAEFESAMRNFMASIDIVERIDDNLSPALINPLQGLAATQAALGRPDLARQSYQRAVHVSHVNEGPHNKDQVDILKSMAELHISQGAYDEATDIQEHIFSIESRKVEPTSLAMVEALTNRANWQHRLQRYHRERVTWRQIIGILEKHYGRNSLELINPLTQLGKSYLFVSPVEYEYQPEVSASSGESYMKRAVRIADENPDATWQTRENTLLALGDFYILSGRPNRASRSYGDAWELLSEGDDPERLAARRNHLETLKILQRVYPPKYYNSERDNASGPPPENYLTGTMSFEYVVLQTGRVANVKHIETQPRGILDFSQPVGRSIRRMMYRPRMVDGAMVDTAEVIYTHEFFYLAEDVQPVPDEPMQVPADDAEVTEEE